MYVPIRGKSNDVTKMYVPLEEGITANVIKGYCPKNGMGELFFRGWKNESILPFDFYKGAAVIHEGKIHILGGENNPRAHYAWNESTNTWSSKSTLPYDFILGSAASYKGRIHIFGKEGGWNNQHYAWDDDNGWVQATSTPYAFFYNNNAPVFNNKICLVSSGYGSYSQFRYIQQWDDQVWSSVINSNNNSWANSAVYKGMIYLLGNSGTGGTNYQTWDGSTFSGLFTLPNYSFRNGYALTYKNRIHLLGNGASSASKNHYSFDGTTLRKESRLPCRFNLCPAVVLLPDAGQKIHLDPFCGHQSGRAFACCGDTSLHRGCAEVFPGKSQRRDRASREDDDAGMYADPRYPPFDDQVQRAFLRAFRRPDLCRKASYIPAHLFCGRIRSSGAVCL